MDEKRIVAKAAMASLALVMSHPLDVQTRHARTRISGIVRFA
jgi:hypothetical protein